MSFGSLGNWAVIIFLIAYRAVAASEMTRTESFVLGNSVLAAIRVISKRKYRGDQCFVVSC